MTVIIVPKGLESSNLHNKKTHPSVLPLESGAESETCCPLIDTQSIIQVSMTFKGTFHYYHLIAACLIKWGFMKMKPSLHSHCLQSSHFCSSDPSLHCGFESHSRPGSKQQPLVQVNCCAVHGAPHFSGAAHKHRGKCHFYYTTDVALTSSKKMLWLKQINRLMEQKKLCQKDQIYSISINN